MGCALFLISSCDHCIFGCATQHFYVKLIHGSPIFDKKWQSNMRQSLFHVCKLQWGSKMSSYYHMHIEGHACATLPSTPMTPVVGHYPFTSPLCELPLGKESSSILSSKVYINSNVLLANIDSDGTSDPAEDVDDTNSLNSAIFPDSSYTSEAFYFILVGDVIAKQYLYDLRTWC